MRQAAGTLLALCAAVAGAQRAPAIEHSSLGSLVSARITDAHGGHRPRANNGANTPPAVMWLTPVAPTEGIALPPQKFTMMQKNKMFTPHILIVPVGSSVAFPNADPFFHNVFSLFDGRRFDLGLYEAGSTRSVVFSREGVSYIFCNIHSEMSAVVIALATPLYGFADAQGIFHVKDVPEGEYDAHVWVEGQKQDELDRLTRRVHISGASAFVGDFGINAPAAMQHLNKFGKPYEPDAHPIY